MLNTAFKGTGSLKAFVAEVVKVLTALNTAEAKMPLGSAGGRASFKINGGKLTLDMTEVLINKKELDDLRTRVEALENP